MVMDDGCYRMFVCERCSFGQYHPMNYCPKCPGKLQEQRVPHLKAFANHEHQCHHLEQHGVKYSGEYPEVPTAQALGVRVARAVEFLVEARDDADAGLAHGVRREKFWTEQIARLLERKIT